MRPETLEQCLTWLSERESDLRFSVDAVWVDDGAGGILSRDVPINSDIPAAIIAATQQVWDQVNGEASE